MQTSENLLSTYFKSIIDQDRYPVVICDLKHTILYMNPAAVHNYHKYGGEKLLGQNLLNCHNANSQEQIQKILQWFLSDVSHNIVYTSHNEKKKKDIYVVALRDEQENLIGYYEKHEYRTEERMKFYDLW